MDNELKIKMYSFTIDCKVPYDLAKFYADLLKWEIKFYEDNFACIGAPEKEQGAYPCILFQRNEDYVPPVWPEEPDKQQQMAHLDLAVNDLAKAVSYAVSCGAKTAPKQYSKDWTVMLDPSGHPFCLCSMKPVMESTYFALL